MVSGDVYNTMPTKYYKIWVEGYVTAEENSFAEILGKSYGRDFDTAMENFSLDNAGLNITKKEKFYIETLFGGNKYNWFLDNRELFDNEFDARLKFG